MSKSVIVVNNAIATAQKMTRLEYNDMRGWIMPADEDPADAGYLIQTITTCGHSHANWIPEEVFNKQCVINGSLNFGQAWHAVVQNGMCIQRAGWNGKNLIVTATHITDINSHAGVIIYPNGDTSLWVPSPTDLVATDWSIIIEESIVDVDDTYVIRRKADDAYSCDDDGLVILYPTYAQAEKALIQDVGVDSIGVTHEIIRSTNISNDFIIVSAYDDNRCVQDGYAQPLTFPSIGAANTFIAVNGVNANNFVIKPYVPSTEYTCETIYSLDVTQAEAKPLHTKHQGVDYGSGSDNSATVHAGSDSSGSGSCSSSDSSSCSAD